VRVALGDLDARVPQQVADLSDSELQEKIASALVVRIATAPVGGTRLDFLQGRIFRDFTQSVIGSSAPAVVHVELSKPWADVVLGYDEGVEFSAVSCLEVTSVSRAA